MDLNILECAIRNEISELNFSECLNYIERKIIGSIIYFFIKRKKIVVFNLISYLNLKKSVKRNHKNSHCINCVSIILIHYLNDLK